EPPTPATYPYCTNTSAGVPMSMVAFGRDGTLYLAHQAYGDGEGPREGKSSIVLARTTDFGKHWQTTLVDNNRGKTNVPPSDTGVMGLTVDTSGAQDTVYVGFTQSFPDAPTDSPLRYSHVMVGTSIDGGKTFGTPVDLNTFPRPKLNVAGRDYQL